MELAMDHSINCDRRLKLRLADITWPATWNHTHGGEWYGHYKAPWQFSLLLSSVCTTTQLTYNVDFCLFIGGTLVNVASLSVFLQAVTDPIKKVRSVS